MEIDFGWSNVYDQTNLRSAYLGFVFSVMNPAASTSGTNAVFYYSKESLTDNVPVTIDYPNQNMINVFILISNSLYPTNYFTNNYIINLEFTPL